MRNYTNSQGEVVGVNREHLDIAVRLKIELQKTSPSNRCDWKKHKKLMAQEGFDDSDVSESYRCLVKNWQAESGLFNSVSRDVDMGGNSKLASLNNLIGDLYSEKRDNQLALQEMNKFKRDFHLSKVIAEEVIEEMKDFRVYLPNWYRSSSRTVSEISSNKAIVVLTDLHVGALIDNIYGNKFNYEIAENRMVLYAEKVISHCKNFNIQEVMVKGLGDFVEHTNMRYKQNDQTEFKLAKQIVKATQLVWAFLLKLAHEGLLVSYEGIAGNHDRLQGDKNIAFDDDNANVIINSYVSMLIEKSGLNNLLYIETDDGATEINVEVNGRKVKLVHGHLDEGDKKDRLKSYISMQNEFFDCLVYGHLHNYDVKDSDHGRMTVGVGCLSGRNDYSKHLKCATNASQLMLIVDEYGEMIPIKVDLQIN